MPLAERPDRWFRAHREPVARPGTDAPITWFCGFPGSPIRRCCRYRERAR